MTSRVAGLALIAVAVCACGKSDEERAQDRKRAEADEYNSRHESEWAAKREAERAAVAAARQAAANLTVDAYAGPPGIPTSAPGLAVNPTIVAGRDADDAAAQRIAKLVIEKCLYRSAGLPARDAWLAVTKITVAKGSIFTKGKDVPTWNVDLVVDAARYPEVLHGNTALMYQLSDDLSTVRVLKDEAGNMCGISRRNDFVSLD